MAFAIALALGGGALIGAAGSYFAGQEVAGAQEQAAQLQYQASQEALDWQKKIYGNIEPYLTKSLTGYQALLQNPEEYKKTPGYMFRLEEGLKAAGIPAGGKFLSGNQIRAATVFGQNYATNEYQNALARIAGLGELAQGVYGVGQGAATNIGNILTQGAQSQAAGVTGAANARASSILGVTNAAGQALQNYQLYNMYNQMNRPPAYQASIGPGAGTQIY